MTHASRRESLKYWPT